MLYCLPGDTLHLYHDFVEDLKNVCPNIEIVPGLPVIEDLHLTRGPERKLVVIDDLSEQFLDSENMRKVR